MIGKKGQSVFGLSQLIDVIISVVIAIIIFGLIAAIWAVLFSSDTKNDATAENVLTELVDLINAQKGDTWETQTFIRFPQDEFVLVGFDHGRDAIYDYRQRSCDLTCICVYNIKGDNPDLLKCENIKDDVDLRREDAEREVDKEHFIFNQADEARYNNRENACLFNLSQKIKNDKKILDISIKDC